MQNEDTAGEKQYTKPVIADHGDLTDITAGISTGTQLDASFPVHTPKKDLTFSTP